MGIDLIELPVSSKGNRYIITLTDYFRSGLIEAAPIPTKEACQSFVQGDVAIWLSRGNHNDQTKVTNSTIA